MEPVKDSLFARNVEIQVDVDESLARDVVLAPGEMSLHHPSIIHGSRANQSAIQRMGFVIRYVTPSFGFRKSELPAVLARGSAAGCSMKFQEPPDSDFERSFARWQRHH
jgi:ectoine hydroxylase-related dioxygenase (phytanoyl-CoA dioxygenase family)